MVSEAIKQSELVRLDYSRAPQDLSFFARYDAHKASALVKRAAQAAAEVSRKYISVNGG